MATKRGEKKQPSRSGRPSLDDPEVVRELCARIAEGNAIYKVCAADDMPDKATVYRRMAHDAVFATSIVHAREAQQDAIADECVELADGATVEDWQVVKLKIWARQWRAAKLAPRRYGERPDKEDDKDGDTRKIVHVNAPGT